MVHRVLYNGRCALGLAAVPALMLGACGYADTVTVPVLLSSWATAWVAFGN